MYVYYLHTCFSMAVLLVSLVQVVAKAHMSALFTREFSPLIVYTFVYVMSNVHGN